MIFIFMACVIQSYALDMKLVESFFGELFSRLNSPG